MTNEDTRQVHQDDADRRIAHRCIVVYLSALLLAKTVAGLLALMAPETAQIRATVQFRQVGAILLLAAICFIAGLVVRTGPGPRAKNASNARCWKSFPAIRCCAASPAA